MNFVALPRWQTEPEPMVVTPASKHSRISGIVPVGAIAHAVVKHTPGTSEPAVVSTAAVESDVVAGVSKSVENVQSAPNARNADDSQPVDTVGQHTGVAQPEAAREAEAARSESTQPETAQPVTTQSGTDQPTADIPDDQQRIAAKAYQEATAAGVVDQQPATETAQQSVSEAYDIDSTGVHTPIFGPGSVFERVVKGELKTQEPAVEVDDLIFDEAKTTQDSDVQFRVARHLELLTFPATNSYLYGDMHSWPTARGEADVDGTLSHNKGYQGYRGAVGE